jgi:hypothetical protein
MARLLIDKQWETDRGCSLIHEPLLLSLKKVPDLCSELRNAGVRWSWETLPLCAEVRVGASYRVRLQHFSLTVKTMGLSKGPWFKDLGS